jgi:hypothetical protein
VKSVVYQVEVLAEQPFESMDFEFVAEIEDDDDPTDVLNPDLYTQILNNLSINCDFLYVEDEDA